jgi:hypothetical protein
MLRCKFLEDECSNILLVSYVSFCGISCHICVRLLDAALQCGMLGSRLAAHPFVGSQILRTRLCLCNSVSAAMYNALKSEPVLAVYCFFIGCLRRVCTCVLEASGTRYCGRRRECKRPKSSNCLYNCTSVHGRRDGGSSFWLPQLLVCPHHCIRPALRSRALAAKPAFFDFDRATVPVHRSFHHHWAQYALGAMAVGVPWPLCLLACLLLGAGGVAGNGKSPLVPPSFLVACTLLPAFLPYRMMRSSPWRHGRGCA